MNNYTLSEYANMVNDELLSLLPESECGADIVCEAMRYSASAGGKRIRPVLTLEFCRICGGDITDALPLACAVEMVHTYSLIHDDLPCMDNDDMRRGRPSCHKAFGESYALLAGDGLLTLAFGCIAKSAFAKKNPAAAIEAVAVLSELAGVNGMIGGQTVDLLNENKTVDAASLALMDNLKTGKLMCAAALLGCIAAGADSRKCEAARIYCENLGLAFQIVDDLLDVSGDEKTLGKPIGSDAQSGKSTYAVLLGVEKAEGYATELTRKAIDALEIFGAEGEFLSSLAESLLGRKS